MNDKSGMGRNLTAAGGARPTSGAATINGLNVLSCVASMMQTANLVQAQPFSYFAVVKCAAAGAANAQILGSNGAGTPALLVFGGNWSFLNPTKVDSATASDTAAHVVDAVYQGAGSTLNLDGATIATGNVGVGGYATVPLSLGSNVSLANPFVGVIGEVLLYQSVLAPADRVAAEQYLKTKWGTP